MGSVYIYAVLDMLMGTGVLLYVIGQLF